MNDIIVARRYAQALFEEAEQRKLTEQIDADVDLIQRSMQASRELVRFFESPVISRDKKARVIQELFAERLQPLMLRFLNLLVEKQRESTFPAVIQAYRALRDRQMGILEVQARAAHALSEPEEQKLRATLEQMTGRRVRLQVRQDAGLLGGLVVRVGDTVYDGSVRHQLAMLREQMGHGAH